MIKADHIQFVRKDFCSEHAGLVRKQNIIIVLIIINIFISISQGVSIAQLVQALTHML